jgi:ribosome-associated toxin RatA of RatAB toxin-antitoxin module
MKALLPPTLAARALCAVVLALWGPWAWAQAVVDVKTSHSGDVVAVRAQATIAAPLDVVWGTLTDYERLPEFVPGLKKSKIIARNGGVVTVQQSGEARFFFSRIPIEVTLESTEAAPYSIEVRRVAGNIKRLDGRYETQVLQTTAGQPAQVELRWTGHIEPENGLPPLVGEALMRRSIRQQFVAMVREIERRESVRQQGLHAAPAAVVPTAPTAPTATTAPMSYTSPTGPAVATAPGAAAPAADK